MAAVTTIDDLSGLRALAAMLPDTAATVITLHTLRRGSCRAHLTGPIARPTALVVDYDEVPGEPGCFADDPDLLWTILRDMPGWFSANMPESLAPAVGTLIERDWSEPARYLGDLYFTLQRPAPTLSDAAVRRLTPADQPLLDAAPATLRGAGFGTTGGLLAEGIAAAAIVDNALVAIAHTFAISDRHADIGVATHEAFRGRGYATAAASLVAQAIQASGRTPVWSCGETNQPSLRVAAKLGFQPALRREYVIVESRR
ncbi:MAG TPA: GNAT family N-acetyltransferase [Thermomicrobiales bacterium]|nr:GNAT family N-acetyltransferase [Thermomicrobiales bacterium]